MMAKNIKNAIPNAEGTIVSGIQKPTIRPNENETFKNPTM